MKTIVSYYAIWKKYIRKHFISNIWFPQAAIVFLGVVALSSAGLLSTIPATTYAHAPIAYTTHAYSPIAYTAATASKSLN